MDNAWAGCQGDTMIGGQGKDNAVFARVSHSGIWTASLITHKAGTGGSCTPARVPASYGPRRRTIQSSPSRS